MSDMMKKALDLVLSPVTKDGSKVININVKDKDLGVIDVESKLEELSKFVADQIKSGEENPVNINLMPLLTLLLKQAAIKYPYTLLPILLDKDEVNINALLYLMVTSFVVCKEFQDNKLKISSTYIPSDDTLFKKASPASILLRAWVQVMDLNLTFDEMVDKMIQEGLIKEEEISWMKEEIVINNHGVS